MMRYSVYQITIDETNAATIDAWQRAMVFRDPTPGLDADLYRKVCEIEADDLNGVFQIGNCGPESSITRLGPMHSLSVGDIIQAPNGARHMVDRMGFRELAGSFA